jgi:hypothetical protein
MFIRIIIISIVGFSLVTCSNEDGTITAPVTSIKSDDIVGTWSLFQIEYLKGDSTVIISPEEEAISITFKFWENKTGLLLEIEKGTTEIHNFQWNVIGATITFVWEDREPEYITCDVLDDTLCIDYSFRTPTGEIVLASYIFQKEA